MQTVVTTADDVNHAIFTQTEQQQSQARVCTAADRPAQRSGSVHAKYSIMHQMVIKTFLLLGLAAEYRSRWWVRSTVVR